MMNNGNSGGSTNPPSYYEQGAASRQRERQRFDYWNSVLIPAGQRKWR